MRTRLSWVVAAAIGCGSPGGASAGAGDTETESSGDAGTQGDADGGTGSPPVDPKDLDMVDEMGMRRLSAHELDRTLFSLLKDDTRPAAQLLPEDVLDPFDNDVSTQNASLAYVEAAEVVGREAAQRFVADAARRDEIVGCAPAGPTDADCMQAFVAPFGRRALRRRLAADDVDEFVALGLEVAADAGDFWAGIEVVVSAFLLDPEFLYRIERGTPVDGEPDLFQLDGYEVATRLSYFLIGTTPPDSLLDAAEAGDLDDADGVRAAAAKLLATADARAQLSRFHGLWLGYGTAPLPPALATAMESETRLLLEDIVFDDPRSWLELFTATGTFVGDELASHYGLPPPGSDSPEWVEYGDSGRAGLLSHGSFLAVGGGGAETNVVRRGRMIRTRLMCQEIPPPPPDVNVDEVPDIEGACKEEVYAQQRAVGQCAGCHVQMDPIGFGLEQYDYSGAFRTHDPVLPSCAIPGDGEIMGVGTFNGPGELAALLVETRILDACAVQQVYRYAMGRAADGPGAGLIEALTAEFVDGDHRFDALLLELVGHPSFGFRREEKE
jgi:hypothetical protein